jgi:CBS domain-containing protein
MKIDEVILHIGQRELPCVTLQSEISEVIRVMVRFPHTRLVYVVDEQKKLHGTITVGSLLRYLFPYHYETGIHSRGILRNITAARAEHIMDRKNVFAAPDDTVDAVLRRMGRTGVKEMAVIDDDGSIVGDITAVDLLRYYHLRSKE